MSPLVSLQTERERIGSCFGKNKTEELCRLLYEIGRREATDPSALLDQTIASIASENNTASDPLKLIPFSKIKQTLLKRRYPNFSESDLKRVYLTPLNISNTVIASPERAKQSSEQRLPRQPDVFLAMNDGGRHFVPTHIFVEKRANNYPLAERVRKAWPHVPTYGIDSINELKRPKKDWLRDFGKKTIAVSVENFDLVKPCPCSSSTVSCNYYLLNIGYGCPFDCSYCYLQDYQNLPAIILPVNVEQFLGQMDVVLSKNQSQFTRIGTGEFADSLALDWLTEYSKVLVPFFANRSVTLELKTKSDCVDNLLGLEHGGKTVIAWSVAPKRFAREEKGTAPIAKRLEAARACEAAGYGTAFHFDPIIDYPGWEADYGPG